jgi:hypothetical protein
MRIKTMAMMTSGAIQYGDPMKVLTLSASKSRMRDTPKSASFTYRPSNVMAEEKKGDR